MVDLCLFLKNHNHVFLVARNPIKIRCSNTVFYTWFEIIVVNFLIHKKCLLLAYEVDLNFDPCTNVLLYLIFTGFYATKNACLAIC